MNCHVGRYAYAFEMKEPPPELHEEVAMQTPGAPPAPVQGPLTEDRGASALTRLVESRKVNRVELRSCMVVIQDRK